MTDIDKPLIEQIGVENYLRMAVEKPIDSGAAFLDATKYTVLSSSDKECLAERNVIVPKLTSECPGFIRRDYKPTLY